MSNTSEWTMAKALYPETLMWDFFLYDKTGFKVWGFPSIKNKFYNKPTHMNCSHPYNPPSCGICKRGVPQEYKNLWRVLSKYGI